MAKYWVSVGNENPDGDRREKRFEKELEKLANHVSGEYFTQYSYVTEDNAANVSRKIVRTLAKMSVTL